MLMVMVMVFVQLQLNVFKPAMINSLLQSGRILGDAAESFAKNCVEGMFLR